MEANLSLMYVISLFSVLIAFAFAAYLFLWVRRQKSTNARINEVAALIKEGANTFMRKEYRVLSIFAGIAAVIIFLLLPSPVWTGHPGRNLSMAAAYVAGTALSAIAGKIGILVATNANARAAEGARQGVRPAFLIGFRGGAVMGLAVVGFSLLGVCGVLWLAALLARGLLRLPGVEYVYLFLRFAGDEHSVWPINKAVLSAAGLLLWWPIRHRCRKMDWRSP